MEKTQQYAERAKASFGKALKDKVEFIAARCWPHNVKGSLGEVNEIVQAAVTLGGSGATVLTDGELEELRGLLISLRTLEMADEVRVLLVEKLVAHGVDPAIFQKEEPSRGKDNEGGKDE